MLKKATRRVRMIRVPSVRLGKKKTGKPQRNPVMSEAQFKKELSALKKIHPLSEHKREQKILKDAKKIEWLHIPSDKELKTEIDRLHKEEVAAAKLLTPINTDYPKLPSAASILKKEAKKTKR
ncbi:hypothetical protein HY641_02615 [Candidatus Woesearchaeota archaeon]|nr:hypothetical protein [Candidatus Woesearchaeota archaeon]